MAMRMGAFAFLSSDLMVSNEEPWRQGWPLIALGLAPAAHGHITARENDTY